MIKFVKCIILYYVIIYENIAVWLWAEEAAGTKSEEEIRR